MTFNGAIMQLVEMRENSMMPLAFKPYFDKVIETLLEVEPAPQWIPVNLQNNSPEENKVVLLGVRFRDDFKYFVTSRKDYNYWTGLGREIKGELRWQPLPPIYRGNENDE